MAPVDEYSRWFERAADDMEEKGRRFEKGLDRMVIVIDLASSSSCCCMRRMRIRDWYNHTNKSC